MAHSGFRYLVLLMGVLVIGYAAYGMATKREYDKTMRILGAAFTGVLDLTILLGFATVFTRTFYPGLGMHIVSMVLAAAVAHVVSVVMKKRPPEQRSYAPHLVSTVIVLAIISVGIVSIGRSVIG